MSEHELIRDDIEAYLQRHESKELLRFVIVGSVDDGKSTLIGRLLFDTDMVFDDQLAAVKKASKMEGGAIDLSLITDGLAAEREQGITIDVAYRYFTTEKRKFIVADTPGHVQYTRNMATGASTANVGIILVDARLGVLEQSRRHAYIASLLGIPHLLVAVNKMDLKDYSQKVYEDIVADFRSFADGLSFKDITFIPVSALEGDNVVNRSERTPWYEGPTVLDFLETVPIAADRNLTDFRFPVQYVLRPHLDYRGFAGQVVSGEVKKGDPIMVLPSGKRSKVKAIDTFDGELEEAFAPLSVSLRLEDEIDCSRGDMLVLTNNRPRVGRHVDAHVVWMHETPLDPEKTYFLKHTTQMIRAQLDEVHWKLDMNTLGELEANTLELNDIGRVSLTVHRPIYYDAYQDNRATGSFVLVDSLTNATVAAGMIVREETEQDLDAALKEIRAGSGLDNRTQVSPRERRRALGQRGCTVWLTGLPGSGRVTLAYVLERKLFDLSHTAHVVTTEEESLESIAVAARALTDAGLITICAFRSYARADRDEVRQKVGPERFYEVFVNTDPDLCRERRPNASFHGFEPPANPVLELDMGSGRVEAAANAILELLAKDGDVDLE